MPRAVSSRNIVLFVSVLLLGIAIRLYGELAYASDANFEFRFPSDIIGAKTWATIFIMALVGSLIGAAIGYRWNRVTAVFMGLVGAAVATAHYSWILGAFLGAPVALFTAWLGPRRVAIFTLSAMLAAMLGVCGGAAAGAISSGPVASVASIGTLLLVGAVAVAISMRLAKLLDPIAEVGCWRRIARRLSLPMVTLFAAVASVPVGITLESIAWLRRVDHRNPPQLRRLSSRCFTRGLCQFDRWYAPPEFRPSDLRKLRRFDGIRDFYLNRGDFDDDSLALLSEWPKIEFLHWNSAADRRNRRLLRWHSALDLSHTRVSGATFAKLSTSLTDLELTGTAVTDDSLKHLGKLLLLESLNLSETGISDSGVANLAGLPALQSVDLSGAKVTDAALASIARNNRSVSHLALRGTLITGAGLARLAELPALVILDVRNCRLIDDDAIQALAGSRSLGIVGLTGTKATQPGAARLRAALPGCMVGFGKDELQ